MCTVCGITIEAPGPYVCSPYIKNEALYFAHAIQKLIRWKQIKLLVFSGTLLLRESPFHIINSLKSFDFKLLFVYTLKLLSGSLANLHIIFFLIWKTYNLLQSLLNVALEWFIGFLTKQCKNYLRNSLRGPRGISEKGVRDDRLVRLP